MNFNNGIFQLNKASEPASKKTAVLTGFSRSGTTMLARVFSKLGVKLYHETDQLTLEDVEFSKFLENKESTITNLNDFNKIIEKRNEKNDLWGFKRPHIYHFESNIIEAIRNPYYILMIRDPIAVSVRNTQSTTLEFHQAMSIYNSNMHKLMKFLEATSSPVMLISYEKFLIYKLSAVKQITEFLNLDINQINLNEVTKEIVPSDERYTKHVGRLK